MYATSLGRSSSFHSGGQPSQGLWVLYGHTSPPCKMPSCRMKLLQLPQAFECTACMQYSAAGPWPFLLFDMMIQVVVAWESPTDSAMSAHSYCGASAVMPSFVA